MNLSREIGRPILAAHFANSHTCGLAMFVRYLRTSLA